MVSDEDLCQQLQSGSEAALEALVHRYHGPIFGYVYRQVHEEAAAQDLVQETFIRVCTRIGQYRYPEPFRPWLYRIALNICRDYWKSAYYQQRQRTESISAGLLDDCANVACIYDWQETRAEVRRAILSLDETYREVLVLRFYQDLKLAEIADILQAPLGTVKWRLFQALRLVKDLLRKEGIADDWAQEGDG
ncbi:MAG: RNA polymerase sigma factor [Bacillota bacterium]|jgi:RNA polymerase sigma factor (sigma-70 family)